jgi:hypothetical protein
VGVAVLVGVGVFVEVGVRVRVGSFPVVAKLGGEGVLVRVGSIHGLFVRDLLGYCRQKMSFAVLVLPHEIPWALDVYKNTSTSCPEASKSRTMSVRLLNMLYGISTTAIPNGGTTIENW